MTAGQRTFALIVSAVIVAWLVIGGLALLLITPG
jgi:hypothetical protein